MTGGVAAADGASSPTLTPRGPLVAMGISVGTGAMLVIGGVAGAPWLGALGAAVFISGAVASTRLMRMFVDGDELRFGLMGRRSVALSECERLAYWETARRQRVLVLMLRSGDTLAFPSFSFRCTFPGTFLGSESYSQRTTRWLDDLRHLSDAIGLPPETFMRPISEHLHQ